MRIIKNKKKTQKEIYDKHADMLYRLCFRYLNNRFDTEEVVHNAFLKIFKHISTFEERGTGSFDAWMKKIAVNESLMFLRKQKKVNFASGFEYEKLPSAQASDQNLTSDDYYQLIKSLPPGYRVVFNLYAIEGYNHKEIAKALGISENTSRSQLMKARNTLKKCLNGQLQIK